VSHGINANILHGWRKVAREAEPAMVRQEFVPVSSRATLRLQAKKTTRSSR